MPTSAAILEQVLRLANAPAHDLTDAELLGRFLAGGEEAAFTLLVQRHGPLVLGVCRRMLGGGPDAEDAFQATFLVLLKSAASVRNRQSLAAWLYGVACRVALKARGKAAQRRVSERQAVPVEHPESADELTRAELRAVLDEEVRRLPEKHRLPVLLCYLEGKSHEQAARELGWPKSSVTARLERAREGLRRSLARRGFAAPAGLVAVVLAEQAAVAVPASLVLAAARPASRAWTPPDAAASLAEGVTGGTAAGKGPALLALVVSLGLAAAGVVLLPRPPEGGPGAPRPEAQAEPLPAGVLARLGSPRLRHGGPVRRMLFSPDGKTLAGLAPDGLYLWDPATGRLRHHLPGVIGQAAFLADGRQLLCVDALKDRTLWRIDIAAGKEVGCVKLPAAARVEPAAIAPGGGRVALGSEGDEVLVLDPDGREVARIPGDRRKAVGLAFSPDGKTLAVADKGDTVRLHDAASGKRVGGLRRERAEISTVVFAPDGRQLAALCTDRSGKPVPGIQLSGDVVFAQVWDLPGGKQRRPLEGTTDSQVCAFSPDGRLLVVASFNADLVVHDLVAGKSRRLHHGSFPTAVAFSPDGKTLAVDHFGNVALRDAATLRPSPVSADPLAGVGTLQFAPDGKRLFGTAGDLLAWDPATGREVLRVRRPEPWRSGPFDPERDGTGPVIAVAPDGSRWAAAATFSSELEAVYIYGLEANKKDRRLVGPPRMKATAVRFSADGRRMAAVDPSRQTVWVWDVDSRRVLWSHKDEALVGTRPLALSPDGRRLAVAALTREDQDNVLVDVLELDTGRPVRRLTIPGNDVVDLAFTPDGGRLAGVIRTLNVGEEVRLWDVAGGVAKQRFRSDGIEKVTFAPDGRMLAGTGPQSPIRLWELVTGKERARFRGHRGPVAALAWSPDGRTLAAASNDAPVYVWDVRGLRPGTRPSATALARAWEALAGEDAAAAFAAVRLFAQAPDEALPFLRRHVRPVAVADPQRLRRLLADLDAERFATREAATAELAKLAEVAEGDLRRAAADGSPEVRRRLEPILSGLDVVGSESRRAIRAIEAIEWMASTEAVRLLDELASGAPGTRLTREAAAARDRLARRGD